MMYGQYSPSEVGNSMLVYVLAATVITVKFHTLLPESVVLKVVVGQEMIAFDPLLLQWLS